MTGKQILLNTLQRQPAERTPWMPFVGAHGAQLIGVSARQYLQSADLIVQGLTEARRLYQPDGLPVVFDLQVEAEVLGCDLHWAEDGPPSVTSHPLAGKLDWAVEDVPMLDMNAGRIPMCMEAARRVSEQMGEDIAVYGLICGPYTLALHLLGNDIFLQMFDQPEKVARLVMRCAQLGKQMARAYLANGCDVVAVVDPMTSQISPDHFEQFVAPAMNDLFDFIRAEGGLSSCFVCGDVTRNLEVMVKTHCDNLSVDEQIDLSVLAPLAQAHNTSIGGNMKLTVVLLLGDEADAKQNAIDCMDAAGSEGFILSPGCDLPFNTPVANIAAAGRMALDAYERDVARVAAKKVNSDTFDDIIVPDYDAQDHVTVDLITLDSETCAPCQYMTDAARRAAAGFGALVQVREHKITSRAGIGMMVKLGVSNLPTICIDGQAKFVSIIPDQPSLVREYESRLNAKGLAVAAV